MIGRVIPALHLLLLLPRELLGLSDFLSAFFFWIIHFSFAASAGNFCCSKSIFCLNSSTLSSLSISSTLSSEWKLTDLLEEVRLVVWPPSKMPGRIILTGG